MWRGVIIARAKVLGSARYLVEQHGFNTVLSESGLPESRLVHQFVLGGQPGPHLWKAGLNKVSAINMNMKS